MTRIVKVTNLSLAYLIKHYAIKAYGGLDVSIHLFLTSILVESVWAAWRSAALLPSNMTGLDDVKNIIDLTGARIPTPLSSSP
jgi:hypothetical protein